MENDAPFSSSELDPSELERLRQALESRYPANKDVLGCELGALIHRNLTNANLKWRFGGLKQFVARYFPAEISLRGKKGLDDLYDISFRRVESREDGQAWRPVDPKPSPALWSALTNPSFQLQFAWSTLTQVLVQAPPGIPPSEGLVPIEKLTTRDYQVMAADFVRSTPDADASRCLPIIEGSRSSVEFTAFIRKQKLLPKWETFRVDRVLSLFGDRLRASGADTEAANHWADLLQASQYESRAQRRRKAAAPPIIEKERHLLTDQPERHEILEMRSVAIKSLEFLSTTELNELRLPLGAVMSAVRSLLKIR